MAFSSPVLYMSMVMLCHNHQSHVVRRLLVNKSDIAIFCLSCLSNLGLFYLISHFIPLNISYRVTKNCLHRQ